MNVGGTTYRLSSEKETRETQESRGFLSHVKPGAEAIPFPLSSWVLGPSDEGVTTRATIQKHDHGPGSPERPR